MRIRGGLAFFCFVLLRIFFRMAEKRLLHGFWHCPENGLIKKIQMIPLICEFQVSFPLLRITINQDKP